MNVKAVIDTNVLVAAFWTKNRMSPTARILDAILAHFAHHARPSAARILPLIPPIRRRQYEKLLAFLCVAATAGVFATPTISDLKVTPVNYPRYCVIDLSGGSNVDSYPVTYMNAEPSEGFNSTPYKTTKLVLKRVDAGSFKMQNSSTPARRRTASRTRVTSSTAIVTLTKPFYMGLFEVTQKQWYQVTGSNPSSSYGVGDAYPVYSVSYNAIRGSSTGAKWPSSNAVDASSFLGKLRAKTGNLLFDLPTEAQWEYACRAGTTTTYSYGDSANGDYMWYYLNSSSNTHEVGTKLPNKWGFYDMHGNVWEWCLDWYATSLSYGTDPRARSRRRASRRTCKGSSSGSDRVLRGGCWGNSTFFCTSSSRNIIFPSFISSGLGFRLSRTLP